MRRWDRALAGAVLVLFGLSACGSGSGAAPDGGASRDGSGSPAAASPAAPDVVPLRVFTVQSSFTVDQLRLPLQPVPQGTGAICGPHYGLQIDRTGAMPQFDADHTIGIHLRTALRELDYPVRAPDGKEFVVVHSVFTSCGGETTSGAPDSTMLRLGGRAFSVDREVLDPSELLVVLVDRGAGVVLEVTDAGQTQTLDLRTAKAGGTVAEYQPVAKGSVGFVGFVGSDVMLNAGVDAELVPYLDGRGQAPQGHCWLRIRTNYSYQGQFKPKPPSWTVEQLFTITGPAGKLAVTGEFTVIQVAKLSYESTILNSPWVVSDATCARGQRLTVNLHPNGVNFEEAERKLTRTLVIQ
ncbi:hypothetical protein ACPPVO_23105 [Dactylosporangium sp. McL0621]|uniref:hypothetical protein n=1 Tax=Dactylosporangium sp. McL0621 TaxID=3415678 RepID=UPI003CF51390